MSTEENDFETARDFFLRKENEALNVPIGERLKVLKRNHAAQSTGRIAYLAYLLQSSSDYTFTTC